MIHTKAPRYMVKKLWGNKPAQFLHHTADAVLLENRIHYCIIGCDLGHKVFLIPPVCRKLLMHRKLSDIYAKPLLNPLYIIRSEVLPAHRGLHLVEAEIRYPIPFKDVIPRLMKCKECALQPLFLL